MMPATSAGAAAGGRDDDLRLLGENRNLRPRTGESADAFRQRLHTVPDAVTPNAIEGAVNRIHEPYALTGRVIDVGNGFDGLFMDVDAFDYYEPGDVFPESPWKLLLSVQEAYGWFFVILPYLGAGEYGFAWDNGPNILLQGSGLTLDSAWDNAFYDGYAVTASAVYASIWETVNRLRLGGIGFTMIRSADLNDA